MFEADHTLPDDGVIPGKRDPKIYNDCDSKERENLEWVIVKPSKSNHSSFCDNRSYEIPGEKEVHEKVLKTIDWWLNF